MYSGDSRWRCRSLPSAVQGDVVDKAYGRHVGVTTIKRACGLDGVQSPISVGPACRAGLRGHAATSEESRSKERPRGDVEWMFDPGRFALRRKSFPAERTYKRQSFPAEKTYKRQSFPAERTYQTLFFPTESDRDRHYFFFVVPSEAIGVGTSSFILS